MNAEEGGAGKEKGGDARSHDCNETRATEV
jgi:hypothetical protein